MIIPGKIVSSELGGLAPAQRTVFLRKRGVDAFFNNLLFWRSTPATNIGGLEQIAQGEAHSVSRGIRPWGAWDTPINDYASFLRFETEGTVCTLEQYLSIKVELAAALGKKLRVLVIGMGTGKQWLEFLAKNDVEFFGAGLTVGVVVPQLRNRFFPSRSKNLLDVFSPSSFDIILTHAGLHFDGGEGVLAIARLLDVGGEAVISMEDLHFELPSNSKNYVMLDQNIDKQEYHFRRLV